MDHQLEDEVRSALTRLERHSTKRTRDGMARYGLPSDNAFGVTMADMKVLAKRLGRNHELAAALWDTGWYEARMLTSFVDEPARVTAAQMDRWCRDFDNWGICDTVCFHLFDRTPHAWRKVAQWHDRREEFVKRAAFALLWGLTVHDKRAGTPLRQEVREHGPACDRQAQSRAQRCRGGSGPAPGRLIAGGAAVGGEGRA
jgi:3-methyladenine DNA glycosylase AlkD